ncbi:putative ribonuclease ZC3H12B [Frankliniella fusca]|uniref:Ribonuclease ZC3H12B n=1 Tax=Frankliniella fusca TaxID=407009 RepID=A0AAE1LUN1_9NEOP|nr:putative ribonuclease ZC3H12B [Frankliniella fusca]
MVKSSSTPTSSAEDKGLIHTGMYLRPSIAASLQRIIRNNLVQERAQFTVAKSQVHPNGLCEIIVKKFSPDVSTVTIMDMLQRCRDCVQDSSPTRNRDSDGNKTIDLSDGDDSVCILSPVSQPALRRRYTPGRRPSVSSISSLSPIPRANQSVSGLFTSAALSSNLMESVKEESIYDRSTLLKSPVSDVADILTSPAPSTNLKEGDEEKSTSDRSTLLISPRSDVEQSPDTTLSAHPLEKVDRSSGNICQQNTVSLPPESVLQRISPLKRPLSDGLKSASLAKKANSAFAGSAVQEDPDSSVLILDISLDPLPSAPTFASSKGTSLSKIQVPRNVMEPFSSSNPENTGAGLANSCKNKLKSESLHSDVLKRDQNILSEPSTSRRSVELLDICEDAPPNESIDLKKSPTESGKQIRSKMSVDQQHTVSGRVSIPFSDTLPHMQVDESTEAVPTLPADGAQLVTGSTKDSSSMDVQANTVPDVPVINIGLDNQSVKPVSNKLSTSSEDSTNESSSEDSLDEIIIEKEVKNISPNNTVLIDDSDDDILVCEVLPTSSNQERRVNKKNKKKNKKILQDKIPAGSVFVASTSKEPSEDFIPLKPIWRRIDPKSSFQVDKKSKLKRIQEKKQKKAQALKKRQLIENGTSSRRNGIPQKAKTSSEKHEYDGNIMNPNSGEPKSGLRPIVIDASNVAVGHGRGKFSVPGLQICIKYFTDKGHKVFAFVPKYRRFQVSPEERQILDKLETEGILSFTPSRTLQSGKKLASYDDRFIVQTAAELGGVVVSTDNFRDLLEENEAWRETIEKRLLMFTWVQDMLLFPNDPLGRDGPHLTEFLRFPNQPSDNQPSTSSSA